LSRRNDAGPDPEALAGLKCFACGKAAGWLEDIARTQDGRRVKACEDCTDRLHPAA